MSKLNGVIGRFLMGAAAALVLFASSARAEVETFDARSQRLGSLLDVHSFLEDGKVVSDTKLFLMDLGRYIVIDNSTGEIVSQDAVLWFTGTGCKNRAYVASPLFYSVGKIVKDYYTGANKAPAAIVMHSALVPDATGDWTCSGKLDTVVTAVPAMQVELPFTLPVSLPLLFQR